MKNWNFNYHYSIITEEFFLFYALQKVLKKALMSKYELYPMIITILDKTNLKLNQRIINSKLSPRFL